MKMRNVGSVVEFSPATREARVRFPDVAGIFFIFITNIVIQNSVQIIRTPLLRDSMSHLYFDSALFSFILNQTSSRPIDHAFYERMCSIWHLCIQKRHNFSLRPIFPSWRSELRKCKFFVSHICLKNWIKTEWSWIMLNYLQASELIFTDFIGFQGFGQWDFRKMFTEWR